ncbi:MAG: phage DNA packaging protein J, partial [Kofleriaceae bacterium]|nr:phage DNA packaging protein J [Kofleriaceae bacterium]
PHADERSGARPRRPRSVRGLSYSRGDTQ